MKPKTPLFIGDVVQLDPSMSKFGGCFMQVTEPKSFGAQGFVAIPSGEVGFAYLRPGWDNMELIGRATWIGGEKAEEDQP